MLKLVFLGRLEDAAGAAQRDVPHVPSLAELRAALEPELAAALDGPRVRVAVNGALVIEHDASVLVDGDEVAFLPPVSGG